MVVVGDDGLGKRGRQNRAGLYAYRATLVAVVAMSLVLVGQAAFSSTPERVSADAPLPTTTLPPTTTTAPTTTTTTAAAPAPAPSKPQPAFIPADSYAPEPIVHIGTIEIPKLGLAHTVYQGVTLRNIDLGPAHWPGTALPGQVGNTVFAGHRVTHDRPFRNLDQLAAGDEVIFTVNGARSVYHVTGNLIVDPKDTWIADQTPTATGTLYACHPPGSAAHRFVVRLALVGGTGAQPTA